MAKANKKSRQIRMFDIVISNRIHFFNRKTDGEQRNKRKKYYRESKKLIKGNAGNTMKKFAESCFDKPKKKDKRIKNDQQIQNGKKTAVTWKLDIQAAINNGELPFSGGE